MSTSSLEAVFRAPSSGKEDAATALQFGFNELISSAAVTQHFPETLKRLESGREKRLIITSRNRPRALLVSVEHYLELLSQQH